MQTIKQSQIQLTGSVFMEAEIPRNTRSLWKKLAVLGGAVWIGLRLTSLCAQEPAASTQATQGTNAPASLSASHAGPLAPWQQRLTLGPGDVLDISVYGDGDSARNNITIGPDGRINYLQARDVTAAGLTVDELRAVLEKGLEKYRPEPKVTINPVAYTSKKYYLLGNVLKKGAYLLDRPITLLEALAKGGGLANGMQNQNVSLLVDLQRSFLVRKTEDNTVSRVPVDFEALFQQGDLSQNVALAPGDYVYLPPTGRQEIYVLGEVRSPGLVPFSKDMTALGAITARGTFSDRAWKTRVLIVRGSLSHPETIVVNVSDILKARGVDTPLSNRDIVYVHRKPWARAQEILESAILDFTRAAATGWTGLHVGPFITEPIFK
jgi:polysaccharide export outer membrane protein